MGRAHAPGEGRGWVEFAGIFYLIAGAFNVIAGIAALERDEVFHAEQTLLQNLTAWAVIFLVLGVAQLGVGVFVLRRTRAGRAWGLAFGIAGLIIWFVGFLVLPWWGIIMFVLYFLILYALTAYREYFQ
jgi:hypothetical protein